MRRPIMTSILNCYEHEVIHYWKYKWYLLVAIFHSSTSTITRTHTFQLICRPNFIQFIMRILHVAALVGSLIQYILLLTSAKAIPGLAGEDAILSGESVLAPRLREDRCCTNDCGSCARQLCHGGCWLVSPLESFQCGVRPKVLSLFLVAVTSKSPVVVMQMVLLNSIMREAN